MLTFGRPRAVFSGFVAIFATFIQAAPVIAQSPRTFQASDIELQFTSFDSGIAINRTYVGEVESLSFFSADRMEHIGDVDRNVADEEAGPLIITVPDELRVMAITVVGTEGTLKFSRASIPAVAPPGVLWPIDGMIDIGSGSLVETIQATSDIVTIANLPSSYSVTIGGSLTDVVALKEGELAVAGDDINLTPQGTEVRITTPDGAILSGDMPAWGYKVYMQPVTDLNAWVPIFAQVTGLFSDEIVTLTFASERGQRIEPSVVTIRGNEATDGKTVAHFLTVSEGDQALNFDVMRTSAPPALPSASPTNVSATAEDAETESEELADEPD